MVDQELDVTLEKLKEVKVPKANEIDEKNGFRSCVPIRLEATSDGKIVKLMFFPKDDVKEFDIEAIELIYELTEEYLALKDMYKVKNGFSTEFMLNAVDRHPFHDKFIVKISVYVEDDGGKYDMEFSIKVKFFNDSMNAVKFDFMDTNFPRDEIIDIFNNDFQEEGCSLNARQLLNDLQNINLDWLKLLENAVYIEDLAQQKTMLDYTMLNVKIDEHNNDKKSFHVYKHLLPPNGKENSLCLIPMTKYKDNIINYESDCIFAQIDEIKNNKVEFTKRVFYDRYNGTYRGGINPNIMYAVRFVPNRISHRASLSAIKKIREYGLQTFFKKFNGIPRDFVNCMNGKTDYAESDFKWKNEKIAKNAEQKVAIKNIVNCTAHPFPYIIFGPPGTGKTSCIVECINQILYFKPNSKILVTTQSNSACDEVGERLLQHVPISKIFRYYSGSLLRNKNEINKKLAPISNLRSLKMDVFPSIEELKYFPITISTLTSSSKFDRSKLQKHFDYIFIDECAATTEPEVLIPILGLGCYDDAVHSSIILIGDHKQLPPVIQSSFACKLGLNISLMERMMQMERYSPKPEYDNRYVIQLLDNYRSHKSILHFSNVEFYESKLRAMNISNEIMIGTKWPDLPNKHFPIIFHSCKTASNIQDYGTSSYNCGEIDAVQSYINKLLTFKVGDRKIKEEDIGIVTPYIAQRDKLKRVVPKNVEIGTSEYYQGREKLIIIISTVKSQAGVGFLSDERRLNVCLTRAKALMIVIGNPDTLEKNVAWKRFIAYCKDNEGFITPGSSKKKSPMKTKFTPSKNANSTPRKNSKSYDNQLPVPMLKQKPEKNYADGAEKVRKNLSQKLARNENESDEGFNKLIKKINRIKITSPAAE